MSNPHEEHSHASETPTAFSKAVESALQKQMAHENAKQAEILSHLQSINEALKNANDGYTKLEKKVTQTEERLNAAWAELAAVKKAQPTPVSPKLSFWGRHKKAVFAVAGTLVGAGVSGTLAFKAAEKAVEKRQSGLSLP